MKWNWRNWLKGFVVQFVTIFCVSTIGAIVLVFSGHKDSLIGFGLVVAIGCAATIVAMRRFNVW